jgi:hypothetical protein
MRPVGADNLGSGFGPTNGDQPTEPSADLTLKNGADVESKDSFNGTGLIRAAHADIAGRLVQAHIKINHINNLGWTALLEAVILGDGSKRY